MVFSLACSNNFESDSSEACKSRSWSPLTSSILMSGVTSGLSGFRALLSSARVSAAAATGSSCMLSVSQASCDTAPCVTRPGTLPMIRSHTGSFMTMARRGPLNMGVSTLMLARGKRRTVPSIKTQSLCCPVSCSSVTYARLTAALEHPESRSTPTG